MIFILGAGPAGLGAAHALPGRCTVFEAAASAGGLCRTIEFDGAFFDPGGHCLHTRHAAVRDLIFSTLPMVQYTRNAECLVHGQRIPYPFQQHFEQLTDETVKQQCRDGLAERVDRTPTNFSEYLHGKFGAGLCAHFLQPYNEKLWRTPLSELATPWARDRVAETEPTDGKALERNALVAYPAEGGFGKIFEALAQPLPIQYSKRVRAIDIADHTLRTDSGKLYRWEQLISTLSLRTLVNLLEPLPVELIGSTSSLRALPLSLILVTLEAPLDLDIHRLYCASDELPAHKLVFNQLSSPWLERHSRPAVMAETSHPVGPEHIKRLTTFLEQQLGARVRQTAVVQVPEAYPIPRRSVANAVTTLRTALLKYGIHTLGRFGAWAYINSDQALHDGLTLGHSLF